MYVCVCVCVCVHVCMYVTMYDTLYVCMYVTLYVCVCTHCLTETSLCSSPTEVLLWYSGLYLVFEF